MRHVQVRSTSEDPGISVLRDLSAGVGVLSGHLGMKVQAGPKMHAVRAKLQEQLPPRTQSCAAPLGSQSSLLQAMRDQDLKRGQEADHVLEFTRRRHRGLEDEETTSLHAGLAKMIPYSSVRLNRLQRLSECPSSL